MALVGRCLHRGREIQMYRANFKFMLSFLVLLLFVFSTVL